MTKFLTPLLVWLTGCLAAVAQPNPSDKLDEYMQAQVSANRFNGN